MTMMKLSASFPHGMDAPGGPITEPWITLALITTSLDNAPWWLVMWLLLSCLTICIV